MTISAKKTILLLISISPLACGTRPPAYLSGSAYESPEQSLAKEIATAHSFPAHSVPPNNSESLAEYIHGTLSIIKGNETWFSGKVNYSPAGKSFTICFNDGSSITYQGDAVWGFPPVGPLFEMRSGLLSWYSYLVLPLRIKEQGFELTLSGEKQILADKAYKKANLTFSSEAKNVPEDWFTVFLEDSTGRIHAILAQVPCGGGLRKRMLVVYEQFTKVNGKLLPSVMKIYDWNEALQRVQGNAAVLTVEFHGTDSVR